MSYEWSPISNQPTATGSIQADIPMSTASSEDRVETGPYWLYPNGKRRQWSTGLFGCFNDMNTCVLGTAVPCHMCFIASSMGESLLAGLCLPMANLILRTLLRGRYNIEGSVMNDCMVTVLCPCCAQCQLAREIKMIKNGHAELP